MVDWKVCWQYSSCSWSQPQRGVVRFLIFPRKQNVLWVVSFNGACSVIVNRVHSWCLLGWYTEYCEFMVCVNETPESAGIRVRLTHVRYIPARQCQSVLLLKTLHCRSQEYTRHSGRFHLESSTWSFWRDLNLPMEGAVERHDSWWQR